MQNLEANVDHVASGQAEAFSFYGAAGTAQSISVYVDSSNSATKLIAGIYQANPGLDGAPLIASGSNSSPVDGAWNTIMISSTAVSSSNVYWIAIMGTGGDLYYRDKSPGTCVAFNSSETGLGALPSDFSVGVPRANCSASLYASGTSGQSGAPVNISPPTVTGSTTLGQSVSTTTGSWTNSPAGYSYQWQDCDRSGPNCVNIAGATSSTFTLASIAVGDTIRSVVTATNSAGSTSASSDPTSSITDTGGGGAGGGGSLPGNPPNTSADVHVGLPATTQISSCCDPLVSANPAVDEVWNFNTGNPALYPSIYKGLYMPGDAQPDRSSAPRNSATQSISWFETYHPDWLEFKCGAGSVSGSGAGQRATNAVNSGYLAYYSNGAGNDYPLDTSNPAVLTWLETDIWGPALATGNYQHLDVDNFVTTQGRWTGPHCGHFDSSGDWVGQYNGTTDDPSWRAHEIRFAGAVRSWLHAAYPNVALAGNLSWSDWYTSDERSVLGNLDLWFDEQGFTNGNVSAGEFNDTAWQDKAAAVASVVNAGHAWQDINQEPVSFANTTRAERQWALGNYLLLKNSASWVYICGQWEYGTLLIAPEYSAAKVGTPTGTYYANQGVYRRDFTNGLVFLNPSSSTSYTVTIPGNTYQDLYGNPQRSSITLPAGSAIVLVLQ
jgi:hypothetical protein